MRERNHVREYSGDPDCLFRIEPATSTRDLRFADGTTLRKGDPILALHFWNEHIPPIGQTGPTLGWARRLEKAFNTSLIDLAEHLERDPALANVKALRGDFGLNAGTRQIVRVTDRFGFEQIAGEESPSLIERLHRSGENVLALLFALAANPQAAGLDILLRGRAHVCMSRATLARRYGVAPP